MFSVLFGVLFSVLFVASVCHRVGLVLDADQLAKKHLESLHIPLACLAHENGLKAAMHNMLDVGDPCLMPIRQPRFACSMPVLVLVMMFRDWFPR